MNKVMEYSPIMKLGEKAFLILIIAFLFSCDKNQSKQNNVSENNTSNQSVQDSNDVENKVLENSPTIKEDNDLSEDFPRIIQIDNPVMYGDDIKRLQERLLFLGFTKVGEADGYYGPLTENAIKTIQYFSGYEQNGKVGSSLWNFISDDSNKELLKNINIVSKYNVDEMEKDTGERMGHSTEGGGVERYFIGDELKRANLSFYGETGKVHNCFYYISPHRYFLIREYYSYPFPTWYFALDPNEMSPQEREFNASILKIIENDEFDAKTTIKYETYLKYNDDLFQIIKGAFTNSEFNVNSLIEIIGE